MLILKHVEYEVDSSAQLEVLLAHLQKTTSQIDGIKFNDIYFKKDKKEFVLFLDCEGEDRYLEWRELCPPPEGANDWYEVLLTKNEYFN
jgi:hypothetical protein